MNNLRPPAATTAAFTVTHFTGVRPMRRRQTCHPGTDHTTATAITAQTQALRDDAALLQHELAPRGHTQGIGRQRHLP